MLCFGSVPPNAHEAFAPFLVCMDGQPIFPPAEGEAAGLTEMLSGFHLAALLQPEANRKRPTAGT